MLPNRRRDNRRISNLPVEICIGSQVTIAGRLKDISLKSAFIQMKSSAYMQVNDELNFLIKCSCDDSEDSVGGVARISRILTGEGIAIYFTRIDDASMSRLQALIAQ